MALGKEWLWEKLLWVYCFSQVRDGLWEDHSDYPVYSFNRLWNLSWANRKKKSTRDCSCCWLAQQKLPQIFCGGSRNSALGKFIRPRCFGNFPFVTISLDRKKTTL